MTLTPQGTEGGFLFTGVIPNSKISGSLGFDGMSLLCIRNQQSLIGVAVTLYCQAVFSGETSFFGNLAAGLNTSAGPAPQTAGQVSSVLPLTHAVPPLPYLWASSVSPGRGAKLPPRDLGSPSWRTPPHSSLPFRPCPHLSSHKSLHVPSWLDPEFTSPPPPLPPSPGPHHVPESLPPVCPLTVTFFVPNPVARVAFRSRVW